MNILLFGGTTEGRILSEKIGESNHTLTVCVATDYGKSLLPDNDNITVSCNRLDIADMIVLIRKNSFDLCIDATHPYAVIVSDNIHKACKETSLKLIRIKREDCSENYDSKDVICVSCMEEAVDYLNNTTGNILVTTGSKELYKLAGLSGFSDRCFVRVLPTLNVLKECEKLGFDAGSIIAIKGPFTKEMNTSMLKAVSARYMITKASGSQGGFEDKINACIECGVTPVIIGRPLEQQDSTYSLNDALKLLNIDFSLSGCNKKAYIVGMGPGDNGLITEKARKAIEESELIIGANRIVEIAKETCLNCKRSIKEKDYFISYDKKEIFNKINSSKYNTVCLVYSGDIGFYSGADGIDEILRKSGFEIIRVPGISSVAYLCDVLSYSWNDFTFISCHGRELSVTNYLIKSDRIAILLGKPYDASKICSEIYDYSVGKEYDYKVVLGENLSYEDECIQIKTAREFIGYKNKALSVLLIIKNNGEA